MNYLPSLLRSAGASRLVCTALLSCLLARAAAAAPPPVSVLTQHYDNARTGANLRETLLNTSNVNVAHFGKLFTRSVDGQLYAQPLYVPRLTFPGQGAHDVVYLATMHNKVYAYDADDPEAAAPLWQDSLGPFYAASEVQTSSDIDREMGILSTPVIDPQSGTLYVESNTKEAGDYIQRLHALDLITGAEKFGGPTVITAALPGTGDGNDNGTVRFDPKRENQRPALLLSKGIVYLAWASHNDIGPYHGWLIGYDATTLKQVAVYNDTANGSNGGIWQGGQGPAADEAGNIYVVSGNGTADMHRGGPDLGSSFIKLSPAGGKLSVVDWFTPFDFDNLNAADADLGSCGPLLVPGTNLWLSGSKTGTVYVLDRDHCGHFQATDNHQIVEEIAAGNGHIHGSPVFWQGPAAATVYLWSENDVLKAFRLENGKLATPPTVGAVRVPGGMPGGFLSISANGSTAGSGVLWASHPFDADANHATVPGVLRAYDAADVTHELWNSRQNLARDDLGNFAKFCCPTVANGKVYLSTFSDQLVVYGLNPPALLPAATITPNGGALGVPITLAAGTPGAAIRYTLDGTLPTAVSPAYTQPFAINQCARLTVRVFKKGLLPSEPVSAMFSQMDPPGTGTGLTANYFSHPDLSGPPVQRVDPAVNFGWPDNKPAPAVGPDNFSVRWTGQVRPRTSGVYTFSTVTDDGVRLWVNGQAIIDNWTDHGSTEDRGTITLQAGRKYDIKMEYYQGGGDAVAQLWWASDCQPKEVVPRSQLYP